ncbi:MAG: hypothetical protein UDM08_04145 [Eggerthellaceae bacterium]|nr:hypothetical protein [Eggerthellaceae bacterium]
MPSSHPQKKTPQSFSREHSSYDTSNSLESITCKSTYKSACKTSFLSNKLKQELLSVKDPQEREYRANVLLAIEQKAETYGTHQAQPHGSRARQFMPFAALKGYADMVQQEEGKH